MGTLTGKLKLERTERWVKVYPVDSPALSVIHRALTAVNYHGDEQKFFTDRGQTVFRPGLIPRVIHALRQAGVAFEHNLQGSLFPPPVDLNPDLDEHQQRAVQSWFRFGFGIIQLPPRGGKTAVAGEIIRQWRMNVNPNAHVLFLVDSGDLLEQQRTELMRWTGESVIGAYSGKQKVLEPITVAMIQSIQRLKPSRREWDSFNKFELVIIDEVHEFTSWTRLKILRAFTGAKAFASLSGTPYVPDPMRQLALENVVGGVVYRVTEAELVRRGRLVEYHVAMFKLKHPHPQVPPFLGWVDVYRRYVVESKARNALLVRVVRELQARLVKTLILAQDVEHARFLARELGCICLTGEVSTNVRRAAVGAFLGLPDGGVLVATNIFKKGITLPQVKALVLAAGGKGENITRQRKGRALGRSAGKARALVVDFYDGFTSAPSHSRNQESLYLDDHSEFRLSVYREDLSDDGGQVMFYEDSEQDFQQFLIDIERI